MATVDDQLQTMTTNFEKTHEVIERIDNYGGYLLIRTLKPNKELLSNSDAQIIADLILSKYHHWQGEKKPNGLKVGMTSRDKNGKSKTWTLTDHKFYGFFDNSKIKADHYRRITFDDFCDRLTSAVEMETENNSSYIQLSKNVISKNLKSTSTYYLLDLDKEKNMDLVAEWQVYDFFYAFISIDRENSNIYLIEFGLD